MTPGTRHLVSTNALAFNSNCVSTQISHQMGGSLKAPPSFNYKYFSVRRRSSTDAICIHNWRQKPAPFT